MRRTSFHLLLFCLTLVPLLWLANAVPFLKDAGELTSSLWNGGIAHPTGFPLLHVLGGLGRSIPLGAAALRFSWLSAASAAAVVLCVAWLVADLGAMQPGRAAATTLAGVLAGTSLLLTDVAWFHSLNVEVYLPSLAMVAFVLYLGLRAAAPGDRRFWHLLCLMGGLSVGLHVTAPMVFGLSVLLVAVDRGRRGEGTVVARLKRLAHPGLPLFAAGALIVLFLPLRAWQMPARMWADTGSLPGLWAHLSGQSIRVSFSGTMLATGDAAWQHLQTYGAQMTAMTFSWLPLVLVGCFAVLRSRRAPGVLLLAVFLFDGLFSVFVNPMGMMEKQTNLVALLVLAVWAGVGAGWLSQGVLAMRSGARTLALPVVLVVVGLLLVFSPARSLAPGERRARTGPHGYRMIQGAFQGLEPDGLLVTSQDDLSALAMQFGEVEQRRPDVLTMVKHFICDPVAQAAGRRHASHWVFPLWRDLLGRCTGQGPGEVDAAWARLIPQLRTVGTAVRWELGDGGIDRTISQQLVPGYPAFDIVWELSPEEQAWRIQQFAQQMRGADRYLARVFGDDISRVVISEFFRLAGTFILQRHQPSGAVAADCEMLGAAVHLDPSNCRSWNNFGVCLVLTGRLDEGIQACASGKAACPRYVRVRISELRYLLADQRYDDAATAYGELRAGFDPAEWGPAVAAMKAAAAAGGDQRALAIFGE